MNALQTLFAFDVSPWELIARASLIYWFLFLLFRFILRRDAGSLALADILVIVLIADAAQNGMAGGYKSVSEAFLLIGTIAAWNWWIDWMSFRHAGFARFAAPQVIPIVRHGTILRSNLRREMITDDELSSQLRTHGVTDVSKVKYAGVEPDGSISVLCYDGSGGTNTKKKTPGAAA